MFFSVNRKWSIPVLIGLIFRDYRINPQFSETLRFTSKSPGLAFLKLNMYDELMTAGCSKHSSRHSTFTCHPRTLWEKKDFTCLWVELGSGLDQVFYNEVGQRATEGDLTVEGTQPHLAVCTAQGLTAVGSWKHNALVTNTTL